MKLILISVVVLFFSGKVFAQNIAEKKPVNLPPVFREVTGTITDTSSNGIKNATIILISKKDSLSINTDSNGFFIFKKVRSAVFVVHVTKLGYLPVIGNYYYNETEKEIYLMPITLKPQTLALKEVTINGTPSIVYKTDTIEYKAKDYKVREYATLDEMLKKMEGMEVANDGSLTYLGQQIAKAKLNGKDFAGGDVAQAIKNLPADIAEKIQIVDDYGDQADRTGIKNGEPTKIINITTRTDRSIGDIIRFTPGAGSDDRYNAGLFAQHINANQELGVIGNLSNTQNGVAPNNTSGGQTTATTGGSGGTTKTDGTSFYYRDQLGKKVQLNTSYSYNNRIINSINSSNGQLFSTNGTSNFLNESNLHNISISHSASFEIEYTVNNYDFLRVIPSYSYSTSNNLSNAQQSYMGLLHQEQNSITNNSSSSSKLDGIIFYQHKFKNPIRNFSIQLDISEVKPTQNSESNKNIKYYKDTTTTVLKDSLQNYLIYRNNASKEFKSVITYVEPLGYLQQLEFMAQTDYKKYNSGASVDSTTNTGALVMLPELTNNYEYSFLQSRISLDYMFDNIKYNSSIGIAVIPSSLSGYNQSLNNAETHYSHVNIVPVFRFQYVWSNTQKLSINYSGHPSEPPFTQLQPFIDKTDPQNIRIGNPDLKPIFSNTIVTQYNNFLVKSDLNLTALLITSFINDPIISNTVQIFEPALNSYRNEIHYLNGRNSFLINGNYNIAKQFDDHKYSVSLLGKVGYQNYTTMSNNITSSNILWRFNERLGIRMNPQEWLEINPFVSYDINNTKFSINSANANVKTATLAVDGKFYFLKRWLIGYSANKSYINGISSDISRNPFVINTYFEKSFLKRKNLILNVQIYDILHQNNYINQTITNNAIIDTKTNDLSRYIMLSLRLNLQKWNGEPTRNGMRLQRRGDGSFIY